MLEIILIGSIFIILINLILKHNKDFSLEINLKLLGLNIKINSKEKQHPSKRSRTSIVLPVRCFSYLYYITFSLYL